jgi:hypothetical protein
MDDPVDTIINSPEKAAPVQFSPAITAKAHHRTPVVVLSALVLAALCLGYFYFLTASVQQPPMAVVQSVPFSASAKAAAIGNMQNSVDTAQPLSMPEKTADISAMGARLKIK